MDYKTYKKYKKRLETARKFVRISRTMIKDIDSEIAQNVGLPNPTGLMTEINQLTAIGESVDKAIETLQDTCMVGGRQLSLF